MEGGGQRLAHRPSKSLSPCTSVLGSAAKERRGACGWVARGLQGGSLGGLRLPGAREQACPRDGGRPRRRPQPQGLCSSSSPPSTKKCPNAGPAPRLNPTSYGHLCPGVPQPALLTLLPPAPTSHGAAPPSSPHAGHQEVPPSGHSRADPSDHTHVLAILAGSLSRPCCPSRHWPVRPRLLRTVPGPSRRTHFSR